MREPSSLLFCNTPHGEAERAVVAVRRVHVTIAEEQGIPARTVRRARPIVAVEAHGVQLPASAAAIPRSGEDGSGMTVRSVGSFRDSSSNR